MKRFVSLLILCSLISTLLVPSGTAAIKPGSTCKKLNSISTVSGLKYTCSKQGKKLIWVKAKVEKAKVEPAIDASPYLTVKDLYAPRDFEFSNGALYKVKLSFEANTKYTKPEVELVFKVDSGKWELPSQEIRLRPTVESFSTVETSTTFTADFKLNARLPIGQWRIEFADLKYGTDQILKIPTREFNLSRTAYGSNDAKPLEPIANTEYVSFKSKKVERFVWPGKFVAFQTISKEYDPVIMGRIVNAFDKAYQSYREITGYTPSPSRQYKNLLVITEMSADEVGCGAGCGYLGATGIELQTGLFNRLYNGVKLYDQYDQAAFYELGRNFWNYASYRSVLKGEAVSQKWFDANTTGFAVYMRFLTMNINEIPGGPWDNGKGVAWDAFYSEMKNLAYRQRDEPGYTFTNTFEAGRPPYSGPLSVNDFWSSVLLYFAPIGEEKAFTKTFLANLSSRPPARSTASGVQNFVDAISLTLGKSIDSEFYSTLKFGDAKSITN